MSNDFNEWCARKVGWHLSEDGRWEKCIDGIFYDESMARKPPDYANSLTAMLEVCRKQGWLVKLLISNLTTTAAIYESLHHKIAGYRISSSTADTPTATLRAALEKVREELR